MHACHMTRVLQLLVSRDTWGFAVFFLRPSHYLTIEYYTFSSFKIIMDQLRILSIDHEPELYCRVPRLV
jgi:hypothetical protein